MSKFKNKLKVNDSIDLRITDCMSEATVVEELESSFVSSEDTNKALKISKEISKPMKVLLKYFLIVNLDVFIWKHVDMVGIDPTIACYALKIDPKIKSKVQRT